MALTDDVVGMVQRVVELLPIGERKGLRRVPILLHRHLQVFLVPPLEFEQQFLNCLVRCSRRYI